MRCQICGEETFTEKELKNLFDKKACSKCIKKYEERDDEFHLRVLRNRRGKKWIIQQLNKK